MTTKEKILFALILLFLSTLFLPWFKFVNVAAAASLAVFAFFVTPWREKWQLLRERRHLQWMLLFFMMIVISVLLSSNFNSALRYLDPRLPLAFFPVSIGLLQLRKEFKEKILVGFAWLTTGIMMLCLAWGLFRSNFFRRPELLYSDSLTEVLRQQSIYISLLVNLSIYIFAYHIVYKKALHRIWMIPSIVFLFGMSYLLGSRNLMLVLYVITIGFAFYYIFTTKRYVQGGALIMGLLIGLFAIFKLFPKTFNRFKELTYAQFDYKNMGKESHYNMEVTKDQWNGLNFRRAAWQCGWELFLTHPIKGVNIGDKKDVLMEKYKEKGFQFALLTKKNVHSNYLDILYSMGIIGLTLFLLGWIIFPVICARRYQDWLSILVVLTFASAWVTEIYFDRSLGGMLTGFFIPFLLTDKRKNDPR